MYVKNGITVLSGLTLIQSKKGGQESSPLDPLRSYEYRIQAFWLCRFFEAMGTARSIKKARPAVY